MRINTAATTQIKNLNMFDERFTTSEKPRNEQTQVVPPANPKAEAPVTSPKGDPFRTAVFKDAAKAQNPIANLPSSTEGPVMTRPQLGTSSFGHPHVDRPDRFGFPGDPSEQNPIDS